MPKPPPTSGVMTRIFSGGTLKTLPASRFFTSQEPWVPQVRVNFSFAASYSAIAARPSMEATMTRLFTTVSRVTCAACCTSCSAFALSPVSQSKATLLPTLVPDQRRARLMRRGQVGGGGQHVVVDHDRLGAVAGGLRRLGDDEGDGVADIADAVLGQRAARGLGAVGAVGVLQRDDAGDLAQPFLRPFLRGDHRQHAGHFQRRRGIDRQDLRRRMRAAQHHAMRRARH